MNSVFLLQKDFNVREMREFKTLSIFGILTGQLDTQYNNDINVVLSR
jgi:hypothetical protein